LARPGWHTACRHRRHPCLGPTACPSGSAGGRAWAATTTRCRTRPPVPLTLQPCGWGLRPVASPHASLGRSNAPPSGTPESPPRADAHGPERDGSLSASSSLRTTPSGRYGRTAEPPSAGRSEEHTSELQSPCNLVCRLLLEKKNITICPPLPNPA